MYIAIDVGATTIRIAAFSSLDHKTLKDRVAIPTTNSYLKDLREIKKTIKDFAENKPQGIAIALAAVLNQEKTIILRATNLPTWTNQETIGDLQAEFNCKVVLENDAVAAGLGVALFEKIEQENFLLLTWGSGLGGALVTKSSLDLQAKPLEPGHLVLDPTGPQCGCGKNGCLETFVGGKYLRKTFGENLSKVSNQDWVKIETALASGISQLLTKNPTKLVVFTGGVSIRQSERIANIERVLNQNETKKAVRLQVSTLGDNAGVFGALSLLKEVAS